MNTAWTARRRARLLFGPSPQPLRLRRPSRRCHLALPGTRHGPARDVAVGLAVGAGLAVTVGGLPGMLLGCAGAHGAWRWLRRRAGAAGRKAAAVRVRAAASRLPLLAELLAACLAAGSGPARAAEAVGRSVGGPLGDGLVRAAVELRLGDEPEAVWARFGAQPGCAELARCMERSAAGGVPAIRDVSRVARESRARRARAAAATARRAAVLVTGPLGLCFLPAFLAVGVAPVVIGLARALL